MILDDDSLNVLRKWLIKHLEPLSDAEPYVLANYVLALLRNDKPRSELFDVCIEELEEFLKDETKQFVVKLFGALTDLENKRFDALLQDDHTTSNNNHSNNNNNNNSNSNNNIDEDEEMERDHKHSRRDTPPSTPPHGERGTRRGDDDDDRRDDHKRRREEEESDEERRYDKRHRERQDERDDRGHDDRRPGRRYEDYNSRGRQQYGRGDGRRNPRNGNQGNQPSATGGRQRQRCRDFEERGYCMNGEFCQYDHGTAPVVVNDVQELQKMRQEGAEAFNTQQPKRRYDNPENGTNYEQDGSYNTGENSSYGGYQQNYDRRRRAPPRKLMGVPDEAVALQPIPLTQSNFQGHMASSVPATDTRRVVIDPVMDSGGYKRPQPYDKQQRFHHNNNNNNDSNSIVLHPTINLNPNHNPPHHLPSQGHNPHNNHSHGNQNLNFKDNSTLLITNIPPDLNTIDQLNSHFKKFGNLVNIQVKSQANKSYVQFANHQEALRALRSVEAVLGNRFIKVFWSTTPSDSLPSNPPTSTPPSTAAASSPPTTQTSTFTPSYNTHTGHPTHNRVFSPPSHSAPQAPFNEVKMEEKEKVKPVVPSAPLTRPVARSAESEKKEKLLELQKKKDELRKQQIAQQKQMLEVMTKRLKAGNLGQAEKDEVIKTMKASTDALQALLQKESTALLQKQQQQLEKQQQAQQAQAQKPPAAAVPAVKDLKKKERLDRELDSIRPTLTSSGGAEGAVPATTSALSSPPLGSPTKASGDAAALAHLQSIKKDLEQQAISMGLDPTALHKIPTAGGRGRGRGRGGAVQHTARGRGRGASMSLDNRPTSLILTELPDELANETALRGHFQTFGDLKVDFTAPSIAIVHFADRFRAESAFANGRQYKSQKLQVGWYNPAALKSQENKQNTAGEAEKERAMDTTGDDLASSTASTQQDEDTALGHFDEDEEETERSWKH